MSPDTLRRIVDSRMLSMLAARPEQTQRNPRAKILATLARAPKQTYRFDALWKEVHSSIGSKATFTKYLREMEGEGLILRDQKSRRKVYYKLRSPHILSAQLTRSEKIWRRQFAGMFMQIAELYRNDKLSLKGAVLALLRYYNLFLLQILTDLPSPVALASASALDEINEMHDQKARILYYALTDSLFKLQWYKWKSKLHRRKSGMDNLDTKELLKQLEDEAYRATRSNGERLLAE